MKPFVISLACITCVPAFSQEQLKPQPEKHYNFTVYRTIGGYRINAFDDRVIVTFETYEGECKSPTYSVRPAGQVEKAPSGVLRLKGSVEVITGDMRLQADDAYYHCGTGEIEPLTNVHLTYTPQ